MAQIPCPECEKTFRTESGLNWHLERIHAYSQGDQGGNPQPDQLSLQQEAEDIAQFEGTRDAVEALEQRIEGIATSHSEFSDGLARLSNRIEDLEKGVAPVAQLQQQVGEQRAKMPELLREVSGLETVANSLSQLVWKLDQDHKERITLRDAMMAQPSPAELNQAREVLREALRLGTTIIQ